MPPKGTPVAVLANALLETLPQDCFRATATELQEVRAALWAPAHEPDLSDPGTAPQLVFVSGSVCFR